jgi:hypothetical protein
MRLAGGKSRAFRASSDESNGRGGPIKDKGHAGPERRLFDSLAARIMRVASVVGAYRRKSCDWCMADFLVRPQERTDLEIHPAGKRGVGAALI